MDTTDGEKTVNQFEHNNQGSSHTSHNTGGHNSGDSYNYDHRTSFTGGHKSNRNHQFEFVDRENSATNNYYTSTSTNRPHVFEVNV